MDFDLRAHTHLLTIAGSRAYGTVRPDSDVDIKGVAIPPSRYFHGFLHRFEQADRQEHARSFMNLLSPEEQRAAASTKVEGSIFNLAKFIALAVDGSPNNWDALFCRPEDVRLCTPIGAKLREKRGLFVSARARYSFAGYAMAQRKLMERAHERGGMSTKHAMHLVRLFRMCREILTTGEVHVWRPDAADLLAIRQGAWSYERVMDWADEEDAALEAIYRSNSYGIPKEPDRQAIDALCIELVEQALGTA